MGNAATIATGGITSAGIVQMEAIERAVVSTKPLPDERPARPSWRDGEILAKSDYEELLPTKQDVIEKVAEIVVRSAATSVLGPMAAGLNATAMAALGPVIDVVEALQELKDSIPDMVFGEYAEQVRELVKLKEKGKEIKGRLDEILAYFDRVRADNYPKSQRYYHLRNVRSGNYLKCAPQSVTTGNFPLLSTSSSKSTDTAFALIHTSRKGVVVLESAGHPGKCIWVAGGSRRENAVLNWNKNTGTGAHWRLCRAKDGSFQIKNKHSLLYLMPFCCVTNTANRMVQGNGDHPTSHWYFEPA